MTILGMDGTEQKVKSKYKTFCNLCRKRIEVGEEVWSWTGHRFMIHVDCSSKSDAMSNYEFRTDSKKRSLKKKKRSTSNQHPR